MLSYIGPYSYEIRVVSGCDKLTSSQLSIMGKFPRPPAPLVTPKPTLPLPFEIMHDIPGLPPFEDVTQTLLAMAETADRAHLMPFLEASAYAQLRGSACHLLLTAIDPTTGDSIVHRAAAAANIDVLDAIPSCFGRNFGTNNDSVRQLWLLVTHQNRAGDTALHAAGRAGSVRGVKGVYRLFHAMDVLGVDDSLHDDPMAWPESASTDCPAEGPIEYLDWSTAVDEPAAHLPALNFVCTKNRAGRDAAEEARSAGHEDLAVWLDGLVARIDRDRMRHDEDYMRKARLEALEIHWYYEDGEEK